MPGLVTPNQESGTWDSPNPRTSIADWPSRLSGPPVWSDCDDNELKGPSVITLSTGDITEIEAAERDFRDRNLDSSAISRETFPLSKELANIFENASEIVHNGKGSVIIRGLDPKRYSHESSVYIFPALCSYIGAERQDFCHIYNKEPTLVGTSAKRKLRPPNRSVAMNFHTDVDAGDILAFYMQGKSKTGGLQRLTSFWTVYNDLMATRPEVVETLAQPWRFEIPWCDGIEIINRPLLYYKDSRMLFTFATAFLQGSEYGRRLPDGPPLIERQKVAVQAVLDTCWKHAVGIDSQPGDLLFVNNFALLHQRDDFVDDVSTGELRHLLCLMLRDPQRAWKQPDELKLFIDARFGALSARLLPTVEKWEALRSESGGARPRGQQTSSGTSGSSAGQNGQYSQYPARQDSSSSQSSQYSQYSQYPTRQSSTSSQSSQSSQPSQYGTSQYAPSPAAYRQQQQQPTSAYPAQVRSGQSRAQPAQSAQSRPSQYSASQAQAQRAQYAATQQAEPSSYQQPPNTAPTDRRQGPTRSASQFQPSPYQQPQYAADAQRQQGPSRSASTDIGRPDAPDPPMFVYKHD